MLLTGVLFVAFAVLQFFNGPYKRLAHEALKTPLLDPESQYNSDTLNPTHSLGEDSKASSLVRWVQLLISHSCVCIHRYFSFVCDITILPTLKTSTVFCCIYIVSFINAHLQLV